MSIESTISLQNNMTPVLESINRSLNYTISALENMAKTSEGAFDISTIQKAREAIAKSTISLNSMEKETYQLNEAHKKYNAEVKKSENLLGSLAKRLMTMAGIGIGLRKFQRTADEISGINARLMTLTKNEEEALALQDMIFKSAQRSRGEFMMTADIVSKLGMQAKNSFTDNRQTVQFAENLNKIFKIAGTDAQGIESVMYNLTQAMATGVLRGQDLNAVISNAPKILEIVAKHLNSDVSKIKQLAEEGKLSASVVKNAILEATGDIEDEFKNIPMTFGQVAIMIKNNFLMQMQPALKLFNDFINSERFKNFANGVSISMGVAAKAIGAGVQFGINAFNFLYDTIDLVAAPLLTLIGIVGLYNSILAITSFLEGTNAAMKMLAAGETVALSFAQKLYALATGQATLAQIGFNTALMASPIFWIPALIMLIIGGIFLVVAAVNRFKGTSISAIGVITGTINVAIAIIMNLLMGLANYWISIGQTLLNGVISFAEFLANVFINPVTAIKNLFYDMGIFVLGILKSIATAIDTVFGSNLANSVNGWIGTLNEKKAQIEGNAITLDRVDFSDKMLERKSIIDAYQTGEDWGIEKETKLKNFLSDKLGLNSEDIFAANNGNNNDLDLDELMDNVGKISDNTRDIKDEVSWDNNNLVGLRDLMQARAITELSKEVTFEIHNEFTGNISKGVDIDDVANRTSQKILRDYELAMNGGI